jgi:predicted RNase H-like HicB family nuclease
MKDCCIIVFYSDEDECYIADIPDFEMCSAFGDTPEEAVHEVLIAKQGIIDSMQDRGFRSQNPNTVPRSIRFADDKIFNTVSPRMSPLIVIE